MDIKVLRSMTGRYGRLRRNQTVRGVADAYATDLIKRGLAVPAPIAGAAKEEDAGVAPARPPEQARNGGRTGKKAKRSSSSPADQARPSRILPVSEAGAG